MLVAYTFKCERVNTAKCMNVWVLTSCVCRLIQVQQGRRTFLKSVPIAEFEVELRVEFHYLIANSFNKHRVIPTNSNDCILLQLYLMLSPTNFLANFAV